MIFHGKIEGIDDLVTFESESAAEIEHEFPSTVNDYLACCAEKGNKRTHNNKAALISFVSAVFAFSYCSAKFRFA